MIVAHPAWARTYYGSLTMTGNGYGSETQTVSGDPGPYGESNAVWCQEAPDMGDPEAEKQAFWTVRVDMENPEVTVSVGPDEAGCGEGGPSALPAGTYSVAFKAGYAGPGSTGSIPCHGTCDEWILVDNFVVNSQGEGSADYDESNGFGDGALVSGWNSVCLSRDNHAAAMAINFYVVDEYGVG